MTGLNPTTILSACQKTYCEQALHPKRVNRRTRQLYKFEAVLLGMLLEAYTPERIRAACPMCENGRVQDGAWFETTDCPYCTKLIRNLEGGDK